MLRKFMSQEQEKDENDDNSSQQPEKPEQQVGSSPKTCENVISDQPCGEEESPQSTNSLIFDGKHWVLALDENDMQQEHFNPKTTSSPIPSKFNYPLL